MGLVTIQNLIYMYIYVFCKILLNVIKEAEQYDYYRHIENSNNKMKTMWNIIKSETEKMFKNEYIYIHIYIYIYKR
jgi:hypothetical protein